MKWLSRLQASQRNKSLPKVVDSRFLLTFSKKSKYFVAALVSELITAVTGNLIEPENESDVDVVSKIYVLVHVLT